MRSSYTFALVMALCGCASSPPSQFYTLSAAAAPGVTPVARTEYGIVVGPAAVPESVDRPQLVLRLSENRVRIVEQARSGGDRRGARSVAELEPCHGVPAKP